MPQLPGRLQRGLTKWAVDLGRMIAGDDLLLLAMFELPQGSVARAALEAEGVPRDRILERIRTEGDRGESPPWITHPPAFYRVSGRAEGIAAALGDGTITPEHVLMAVLWDPTSHSSQLLWHLGVSRDRILARLGEAGIPVISGSLPEQREIELGERVWIERKEIQTILEFLGRRLGLESKWGWNYEGDRAWVQAESHIDLEGLVNEALGR